MNVAMIVALCSVVSLASGAAAGLWGASNRTTSSQHGQAPQTIGASAPSGASAKLLREVHPIVTNLGAPAGAWIRVELAVVLAGPANPKLDQSLLEFVSDATDFLRTLTAKQIEGSNGLRRLREDLLDRARFRVGSSVEAVLIETLVVQ